MKALLLLAGLLAAGLVFWACEKRDGRKSAETAATVLPAGRGDPRRAEPDDARGPFPLAGGTGPESAAGAVGRFPEEKGISMLFFGDLMLDRHVGETIGKQGLDYLFEELAESGIFTGRDLVSANLEGAVTDNGEHYAPAMVYDFAFAPELIGGLKKYNFNFFTIANNHLGDQGERGVAETEKNLESLGFAFAGCRDAVIDDCSASVLDLGNEKIALAAFSQVYARLDEGRVKALIGALRDEADAVIVNIHWGREYERKNGAGQQTLAHEMIDAGADVIVGHHPHVIQGIEIYGHKPIFYSLGNFVFDQYFSEDTQEGLALGIGLDGDGMEIDIFPLKSDFSRVRLMDEDEKKTLLAEIVGHSSLDETYAEQVRAGRFRLEREGFNDKIE